MTRFVLTACVCMGTWIAASQAACGQQLSIDEIFDVWRDREKSTSTLKVRWKHSDVDRGAFSFEFPAGTRVRDTRDETTYIAKEGGRRRILYQEGQRKGPR